METKVCKKCGIEKELNKYSTYKNRIGKIYYKNVCKECILKYNREYRKNNPEKIKEWKRKDYYKHIEKYHKNNKIYRETHKEHLKEYNSLYRKNNKEKLNKYWLEYKNKKYKNDNLFKFISNIRRDISRRFTEKGFSKTGRTKSILGCDFQIFYNHLLETFKNNYGYEWDEKEPVHIDHIIPLATAKTEEDIIKLCHYKNLQLLKAKDNLQKGSKLNWKLEKGVNKDG